MSKLVPYNCFSGLRWKLLWTSCPSRMYSADTLNCVLSHLPLQVAEGSPGLLNATVVSVTFTLWPWSCELWKVFLLHDTCIDARVGVTSPPPRPVVQWAATQEPASSNSIFPGLNLSPRPGILVVSRHQKASPVLFVLCLHKNSVTVVLRAQLFGTPGALGSP